ncbi:MAG: GNAT family N-acetyltransferase [Aerococcus sp.]|nr:GNAT family N-acetyltransferase [Aerococcus sp.]
MQIVEVTEVWQLALCFEVRQQTEFMGHSPSMHEEFDEKLEDINDKYIYIIAYDDEKALGTARLSKEDDLDDDSYFLSRVSIVDDQQGSGIGQAIIKYAEKVALDHGRHRIVLHAVKDAVEFYEKTGYEGHGDYFVDVTVPVLTMDKQLNHDDHWEQLNHD